jgi:actin-related protein
MTVKTAVPSAYTALLGELETLAKATDVNQERIEAGRKAEGHMQSGESMAKSEEAKKKEKEEEERKEEERKKKEKNEGKEEHMHKSFTLETADGKTVEVQDASELIKSLTTRLDQMDAGSTAAMQGFVDLMKSQGVLLKSMTEELAASKKIQGEQAELIKSLKGDVEKLGAAPAGRRAVLSLTERPSNPSTEVLAKSGMPDGITVDDFFAKAFTQQNLGKITGAEIAVAEASLQHGQPVPEAIVKRVMAA